MDQLLTFYRLVVFGVVFSSLIFCIVCVTNWIFDKKQESNKEEIDELVGKVIDRKENNREGRNGIIQISIIIVGLFIWSGGVGNDLIILVTGALLFLVGLIGPSIITLFKRSNK